MAQPLELFAYEALLDQRRMREAAGDWDGLRTARLPGTRLVFTGWSEEWKSAMAALAPAAGETVYGVLYGILPWQLRELARRLPAHREMRVTVETADGWVEAVALVPGDSETGLILAEAYLRAVDEGMRQHGFTPEIRRRLREWAGSGRP